MYVCVWKENNAEMPWWRKEAKKNMYKNGKNYYTIVFHDISLAAAAAFAPTNFKLENANEQQQLANEENLHTPKYIYINIYHPQARIDKSKNITLTENWIEQ